MLELDMEIKCNFNPYYNNYYDKPRITDGKTFLGRIPIALKSGADIFVEKPEAIKNATGFNGLWGKVKSHAKNYVKNIEHTYDHKIVFALIEKELFGKNSIDSVTHDLDKMIMYILGFPKSFVSKFHRKHSVHHPQSGKKPNLRSMLCDNIASSPEFKPEKKLSLREHYNSCPELQRVLGFKRLLEKYNYGENLDFTKIKAMKKNKYQGLKGVGLCMVHTVSSLISSLLILPK